MFKKGHIWELRDVYDEDYPYKQWLCVNCGINEDAATRRSSICLRFSWLVYLRNKIQQKRRDFFDRLGRLILKWAE